MRQSFFSSLVGMALLVGAGSGCAGIPRHAPVPTCCCKPEQGIIYVADGAGGFGSTTAAVQETVSEARLPLCVESVEWSHGYGRFLADQVDFDNAREAGRRLAETVQARRQNCPGSPIFLVGHSAGSAVILAAAECLPAAAVDDIILLAPAVSADYDLRPALRCVRRGIDVYYSERDVAYLGLGTALVGTADRQWSAAAGRVGFRPIVCSSEDSNLYARLRQHAWDPCMRWLGNRGGHYGCHHPEYLRAYVLPVMAGGS